MRKDLSDLVNVCDGTMKQTNEMRALLTDLNRGTVPAHWAKFKMPRGTSVGQYITDLVARLAQLERIASNGVAGGIWLGGLFQPEAYITATRQAAAHSQGWSLEQLALSLKVEAQPEADTFVIEGECLDWFYALARLGSFAEDCGPSWRTRHLSTELISGLKLHGAQWAHDKVVLNDGQTVSLGASVLAWTRRDRASDAGPQGTVNLPVYLNGDRSEVLFSADLVAESGLGSAVVAERGVCITAV